MPPGRRGIPRPPSRRKRTDPDPDAPSIPPVVAKSGGDLITLAGQIRECVACDRACDRRAFGTGHPRAAVMLVAERPTNDDLESTGALTAEAPALDKAFDALGVPLSWVYGSTAVRCDSTPATESQIEACSVHLLIEVEAIEPRVLVAFGPKAAYAVRCLHGRCGIVVPSDLPQGTPVRLRPGLSLIVTEPMPDGVTNKDAKRRLWRDLQQVPELIG